MALARNGALERYGVELIGASVAAIDVAEDRLKFRDAMREIGCGVPESGYARSLDEALTVVRDTGFPSIIRPSFTLGGVGSGIAYNVEEFQEIVRRGLAMSPVHEVLIEESLIGWKEYELEVMRDSADNFVVICSIENIDPMGVHTGDSITVAPALTLTDKEYQAMRDAARRIIRRVGVETGGSNIQFAVNPRDGRMIVIEMNPRVSRSSALASKATGFPIAKIAAKLALGYHLDEIPNDITRLTPASFEPTIDYVVVKIPRWNFEKFPEAERTLTTQMKSVGEVMAIGRTFQEAFMKGVRSLEMGRASLLFDTGACRDDDEDGLRQRLLTPNDGRLWALFEALERGWSIETLHELTQIDPWFLAQFADLAARQSALGGRALADLGDDELWELKRRGFGDAQLASVLATTEASVRERRARSGIRSAYKRIDTCAAEFESLTPYLYGTYEHECEADPTPRRKAVILGSGPNRIGQGIEFDYCCCHAVFGLRDEGFETVMVNCNPETVSTDYDTSDRLYFEPLALEDVLAVIERERAAGADVACLVQFGGQTPLKLSHGAARRRRGDPRHVSRLDRPRRGPEALRGAAPRAGHSAAAERHGLVARRSAGGGGLDRVPRRRQAVLRARRPGHGHRVRSRRARSLHDDGRRRVARAPRPHRPFPRGRLRAGRRRGRGCRRRGRHRRHHGAHRGGRHPLGRQLLCRPPVPRGGAAYRDHPAAHAAHREGPRRGRPDERPVRHQGRRRCTCSRSIPVPRARCRTCRRPRACPWRASRPGSWAAARWPSWE